MKIGDLVVIQDSAQVVLKELSFSEYVEKCDSLMLEYDIDDAWKAWQSKGPCYEVLNSLGEVKIVWRE